MLLLPCYTFSSSSGSGLKWAGKLENSKHLNNQESRNGTISYTDINTLSHKGSKTLHFPSH